MKRFHINPTTELVGQCKASTGACPFGDVNEHFSSREDAQAHLSKLVADEHSTFKSKKLKSLAPFMKSQEAADESIASLYKEHEALMKKLTPEQAHALRYYAMAGSGEINRLLNGVNSEYQDESDRKVLRDMVTRLDEVVAYGKPEKRTLFRYLKVPAGESPQAYAQRLAEVGDYKELGFMSTTEDPSFIAGYIHSHRKVKFILLQLEATGGVSLQPASKEKQGHLQSFEQERLLQRGKLFAVEEVSRAKLPVAEDRAELRKQFAGWSWEDWSKGTARLGKITSRSLPMLKLSEKD